MADIAIRVPAPLAVEEQEGFVVAWGVLPDGNLALFFDPGAADETGRRLRELTRQSAGAPMPSGHIAVIDIAPPTSPLECADLTATLTDGRTITLTLGLADLQALADTASKALAAVEPGGTA